jgi:predicted transcriptional regulator
VYCNYGENMKRIQNQILEFLSKTEASGSEIASKLGINRLTITKYLNVVHALGLIDFKTIGRAKIWFLKEKNNSESDKSKSKDSIEQYKDSLEIQKKIIDYLKNNPYGQSWEVIAKDLNLSKEQVFSILRILKNNDMISYRDKGNRLWYINYFPTTKNLTEVDIEEIKYKIVNILNEKPLSLPVICEQIKVDMNICAKVIGVLKEQNIIGYVERAGTKLWILNKDQNTDNLEIKNDKDLLLLNGSPAIIINGSFLLGLYLTFNKEMIRRITYFQGLYNTRMKKYLNKAYEKDQLFSDQIVSFLKTGYGNVKHLRVKPFKLVVDKSTLGQTVKDVIPQFSNDSVCTLICGYIEGAYEAVYNNKVRVSEIKCIAKNDDSCEFIIE